MQELGQEAPAPGRVPERALEQGRVLVQEAPEPAPVGAVQEAWGAPVLALGLARDLWAQAQALRAG